MSDFGSLKVEQIKLALLLDGVSESEVNDLKGKAAFVEAAKTRGIKPEDIANDTELVGSIADAEVEEGMGEAPACAVDKDKPPTPTKQDLGWHDYVFGLFDASELFNNLPTINGLRRVARIVLGEPVYSGVKQLIVTPGSNPHDPGRATCVYSLTFLDYNTGERTYDGVASSYIGNTDDAFAAFPESIAETRAESRALRKALGLNVHSAEEMTSKQTASIINEFVTESTGEYGEDQNITASQVKIITKMCGDLGVDVNKFINKKFYTGQADSPSFVSIESVPRAIAGTMIQELNKYQTETDVSKAIPAEIKV